MGEEAFRHSAGSVEGVCRNSGAWRVCVPKVQVGVGRSRNPVNRPLGVPSAGTAGIMGPAEELTEPGQETWVRGQHPQQDLVSSCLQDMGGRGHVPGVVEWATLTSGLRGAEFPGSLQPGQSFRLFQQRETATPEEPRNTRNSFSPFCRPDI